MCTTAHISIWGLQGVKYIILVTSDNKNIFATCRHFMISRAGTDPDSRGYRHCCGQLPSSPKPLKLLSNSPFQELKSFPRPQIPLSKDRIPCAAVLFATCQTPAESWYLIPPAGSVWSNGGANVVFEKIGDERWRRFHQTIMGEV